MVSPPFSQFWLARIRQDLNLWVVFIIQVHIYVKGKPLSFTLRSHRVLSPSALIGPRMRDAFEQAHAMKLASAEHPKKKAEKDKRYVQLWLYPIIYNIVSTSVYFSASVHVRKKTNYIVI